MRSFAGTLRLCTHGWVYELWCVDGTVIGDLEGCESIPLETPLEVMLDGTRVVEWNLDHAAAKAAVDLSVVDMAMVKVMRKDAATDRDTQDVVDIAKRQQDHLAWLLRGSRPVKVTPYVIAQEDARLGLGAIDWVRDRIIELYPDSDAERHNHWHGLGGGCPAGAGGVAYMSSGQAWSCGDFDTVMHETLHSLRPEGIGHDTSDPDKEDYGGPSVMGASGSPHVQPAHQAHLDLIEPNNIGRGPGRYFLVDSGASGLAAEERKIVFVETLSTDRFRSEFAVSCFKGTVRITGKKGSWIALWNPGVLFEGQSTTFEGIQVKFERERDGVAEVVIGSSAPEAPFPGIALPDEAHPFDKSMDGIWHHPERHLQGLTVHVTDDGRAVVHFFGWRADGEQAWYIAMGPIVDGIASLNVWTVVFDGKAVERLIGKAWLWFHDANHGTFKWRITDPDAMVANIYGTQLERVVGAVASDFHGVFQASNQEHTGLASVVTEEALISYWFRYFFEHRRLKLQWLFMSGTPGPDGRIIIEQPWGGVPGTASDDILNPWGQGQIGKTWFSFDGEETGKGKLARLV